MRLERKQQKLARKIFNRTARLISRAKYSGRKKVLINNV